MQRAIVTFVMLVMTTWRAPTVGSIEPVLQETEQWHFSSELDITPMKRPVEVPDEVLVLLRKNSIVLRNKSCLREAGTSDRIPSSWFVASEVHLDGPDERDLIILPKNGCFLGANLGPFWIVRNSPEGYRLVLSWVAHDLEVLPTRSNGYHDIRLTSATADMISTTICRFDGQKYQPFKKDLSAIP
jgi:hypothetical protein